MNWLISWFWLILNHSRSSFFHPSARGGWRFWIRSCRWLCGSKGFGNPHSHWLGRSGMRSCLHVYMCNMYAIKLRSFRIYDCKPTMAKSTNQLYGKALLRLYQSSIESQTYPQIENIRVKGCENTHVEEGCPIRVATEPKNSCRSARRQIFNSWSFNSLNLSKSGVPVGCNCQQHGR